MFSDLKLAWRHLRQQPAFSVLAVLTLALGIGANTALFSVVDGVLLRPLPFPEQARIVTLWERNPALGMEQQRVAPITLREWQTQTKGCAAIGCWTSVDNFNLVTAEGTERVRAAYVSANLFSILRVNPALGRGFLPEDDAEQGPQVAVLSHRFWLERCNADPAVLGRPLTVDTYGRRTYTIVGVMPAGFDYPDATDLWLPAGWNGIPRERRGPWLNLVGRLAPGVRLAQARAELSAVQARIARANPNLRLGTEVAVVPLLQQLVGTRTRTALLVLWGVVAGVLLIACANVANLMLTRATARQKEIAIRITLGASRGRIVRQLLTESVLLAVLGGIAGAALAVLGVKGIVAWSPPTIARLGNVAVDGTALAFTAGAALLTGMVFGLAPAWQGSRPNLNETLKAAGAPTSAGPAVGRTRRGLVVAQMTLATVLLVLAGLMLQSFAKLVTADRGFRAEHLLTAELDFSVAGFTTWVEPTGTRPQVYLQRVLEQVRGWPGVAAAGAAYAFPALRRDDAPPNNTLTIFGRPDAPGEAKPVAFDRAVTPGYIAALGLTLRRGRDFAETDALGAPGAVVVNETFARRYFPHEDPIGKYLAGGRATQPRDAVDRYGVSIWNQIVGVVSDMTSLTQQPQAAPEIYHSYWQWPMQAPMLFIRTTGDPAALAEAVRRAVKATIPSLPPPTIRLMTERVGESIAQPRFQAALLNLFGGIGLLLAACGIYGVLAYSVAQRQRELGIRLALGAQKRDILVLVLGQGLRLAALGIALGLLAATWVTSLLRNQFYAMQPLDPLTFGAAAATLLLVALAACWLPARSATKVDPMVALRAE